MTTRASEQGAVRDTEPEEGDFGLVVRMLAGSNRQERYDIQETVIYTGRAARGALASAAVWTIKRVDLDGDGNPTQTRWTDSTAIWDNRAAETYT